MSKQKSIQEILGKLEKDIIVVDLMLAKLQNKINPSRLFEPPQFKAEWSKNGWKVTLVKREEQSHYTNVSSRASYHKEEFESNVNEDLQSFQSVADEIQAGSPLLAIDNLGGPQRQLVQSPDKFYVNKSNSRIFIKVDEETQAADGNWGSDSADSDEGNKVVRNYLVRHDLIDEEASNARVIEVAFETTFCLLTDIPQEVMKRVEELIGSDTEEAEAEMDGLIGPYLTNDFASGACGDGYSAPKTKFDYVYNPTESDVSKAARKRREFFMILFGKASAVSTTAELYGTDKKGFYDEIRDMYNHDKQLNADWSTHGDDSASELAREKYIKRWWDTKRGNQKKLDAYLWLIFDRKANTTDPVYHPDTGALVKERKRYDDAYWMQRRTKALKYLFLTNKQWNAVYGVLNNTKRRIKASYNPDDVSLEARDKIRASWKQIETIDDLKQHIAKAQTRVVKDNGIVEFSVIDFLSMADEADWRKSCARKRKHFIKGLMESRFLEDKIKEVEDTDAKEVSVSCPHIGCGCMAIGQSSRAIFNDGTSRNFVECEGCSQVVWLPNK